MATSGTAPQSYLQGLQNIWNGPARPLFINSALFIAGVAFLQSPLAEFLRPEL